MGLAGFNRARLQHQNGVEVIYASAPKKVGAVGGTYIKQTEEEKCYCGFCDKRFNNKSAYEKHMIYKHLEYFMEQNPDYVLPKDILKRLEKESENVNEAND